MGHPKSGLPHGLTEFRLGFTVDMSGDTAWNRQSFASVDVVPSA